MIPPMGPSEPPMGGDMPPMDGPDEQEQPMMDDEPPMDDSGSDDGPNSDLINTIKDMDLSIEDKNAIEKYAKSIAGDKDEDGGIDKSMRNDMPMEQRMFINSMVNEISEELMKLSKPNKKTKRPEKKITSGANIGNPFVSNR